MAVVALGQVSRIDVASLLARYGLRLELVPAGSVVPGSFWGDSEAGLKEDRLYARLDTPLHSILHEAAHFVCMTPERRSGLDTDAGGDDAEENGVCYLQILLADQLRQFDRTRMMRDMDEWGYSFRLGSAAAWFAGDAEDAKAWLAHHRLIENEIPTWRVRDSR